jgi:hypothetical protein
LQLTPNVKKAFGTLSENAATASTALGLAGTLVDPLDPQGDLLTVGSLLVGSPLAQDISSPLQRDTAQLSIDGASIALSCVEAGAGSGAVANFDLGCGLTIGSTAADVTSIIAAALQSDPPDANYKEVFVVEPIGAIPVPLNGITPTLGSAMWSALNTVDQSTMWLNAVRVTANRYGTALAANDAASAGLQYMAFLNYLGLYVKAAGAASADLTSLASLMESGGIGIQPVTNEQLTQGLSSLDNEGASSPFVNQLFASLGFTPTDIHTMIQQVEADPPTVHSMSPVQALQTLANGFAAPGVDLVTTLQSLTLNSAAQYVASITVTNMGSTTAGNVAITAAGLNNTSPSPAAPINLGDLSYAKSTTIMLSFPASVGSVGSRAILDITESYAGGSAGGGFRVTLP